MEPGTRRSGALLLNLGTPRSPEVVDVRRYLREFLGDPLVIDISGPARWLLVNLVIAPFRAPRSARAYRSIWGKDGSPLLVHSLALRDAVAEALGEEFQVELAMRYGEPSIAAALARLAAARLERIVVLPLFPQYASSSTGSALARVHELALAHPGLAALETIEDFYADPGFIVALASVSGPALEAFRPDHVLMSYHGLPERQVQKLDTTGAHCLRSDDCCAAIVDANRRCYRAQTWATSRALAKALQLPEGRWSIAYQSRLGRTPWIRPYTDLRIPELAASGVKRLAVLCPSFVADCLETDEEIGIRAREQWLQVGGEALELIPCLNADPVWVGALCDMLRSRAIS